MRPQIQRVPGVRAAVDVAADFIPTTHDEAAQGPVAAAERECARAILLQVDQAADHTLEVELSLWHGRSRALPPWPSMTAVRCRRSFAATARRETAGPGC